jgi:DNA polymerase-1
MVKKRLYLIDATAFCYRAFYALPGLTTSFGQPTNAIYGFINILNKILKTERPDYLAVCFDVSRQTFRTKKFSAYKLQRPPMPDGLSSQLPFIKRIVAAYGIAIFEKEGYEADDIIATIAQKAKTEGFLTTIVSSDKDILQLVSDQTLVFSPSKDTAILYDYQKVMGRFGVSPERIADIIALMGDSTDNIPGIPGIGEKTATALISNFGSIEELFDKVDHLKQEKIKTAIINNKDKIALNKELALLDKDVGIDLEWDSLKLRNPDYQELFEIFKSLEFKKFLSELPKEKKATSVPEPEEPGDNTLDDFLKEEELSLFYDDSPGLFLYRDGRTFRFKNFGSKLKEALENPQIKKISHDLKRIKISLARAGITLRGLYFDTMIAAYLLNPSKAQYGLADVACDYLGESLGQAIGPAEKLSWISQLKSKLEDELEEKSVLELFHSLEMPLVEVLAEMELAGVKIDAGVLKRLSAQIEDRLIRLIQEIYELSGTQFNINSPKQLRDVLFVRLKLPVVKKSKTGPSTDEEVLRSLSDKHKLPALLLEYRQLTKLKNTYIDTLPKLADSSTGKIHASFNQTGTETGRLSSSNPNLQNIPIRTDIGRSIRRAIIASGPDNYLLSCDYSQVELRILAHLSGDENLIEAFRQDKDIHIATASLLYGIAQNNVTDQMRQVAKRVNFGIVYGLSAFGLSRDLEIGVDQAQAFIDTYFNMYPKVKDYIQEEIAKAEEQGFVTTILGRRRYLSEIKNKNLSIRQFAQRQAVNTPIQGSASDLIKLAMVQINNEIKVRRLRSRMVLQIHDELVFDVPGGELSDFSVLVKNKMENAFRLDVPVKVQVKRGRNWLEMEEMI